jgi:hypothetical protein
MLLFLIVCTGSVAHAENKAVAREAFEVAGRLYDLGHFQEALDGFKRAYLNYPSPAFLFNIAQCHRALGNKNEALLVYRAFLRKSVDAKERNEVRALVAQLEEALAAEASAKNAPPVGTAAPSPPPPPENPAAHEAAEPVRVAPAPLVVKLEHRVLPPARRPIYRRWWLWTAVGVAAAAVAVGVGVGVTHASGGFQPTLHDFSGGHAALVRW